MCREHRPLLALPCVRNSRSAPIQELDSNLHQDSLRHTKPSVLCGVLGNTLAIFCGRVFDGPTKVKEYRVTMHCNFVCATYFPFCFDSRVCRHPVLSINKHNICKDIPKVLEKVGYLKRLWAWNALLCNEVVCDLVERIPHNNGL